MASWRSLACRLMRSSSLGLSRRKYGTAPPLVEVTHDGNGIATLTMQRGPVNSLNTHLLRAITEAVRQVEADPEVDVMILRSAFPNIFSAGLDLLEMRQPVGQDDAIFRTHLRTFWTAVQDCWATLYDSRVATIAAVGGHAAAMGCELALVCDHRIAVRGPYTIGLNEAQFGLVAPPWFIPPLANVVGKRQADRMLQLGLMVPFEEANRLGMFDEMCEASELMDMAQAAAKTWKARNKTLSICRHTVKRLARQADLDVLLRHREEDVQLFLRIAAAKATQEALNAYVAQLTKKRSAQ